MLQVTVVRIITVVYLNLWASLFHSGCIVKHWSPLLATSKAQQLLFRIVDVLLLPHHLTQQDKAIRNSLPLYLQVRRNIYCTLSGKLGHTEVVSILTLWMYSPAGSVGGLQRVSVSGCLPEAAAPLCHSQISGPFPSRVTFHGHHHQPPSASECLRGHPNEPGSSTEEDHPRGALVGRNWDVACRSWPTNHLAFFCWDQIQAGLKQIKLEFHFCFLYSILVLWITILMWLYMTSWLAFCFSKNTFQWELPAV